MENTMNREQLDALAQATVADAVRDEGAPAVDELRARVLRRWRAAPERSLPRLPGRLADDRRPAMRAVSPIERSRGRPSSER
jgi:hypothetical protein